MALAQKKYKVHEAAKDFGLQSKNIIELLANYFEGSEKKYTTALTDRELDVVFEVLTQESATDDLSSYFAAVNDRPKKQEPEQEQEQEQVQEQEQETAPQPEAAGEKAKEKPKDKPADKKADGSKPQQGGKPAQGKQEGKKPRQDGREQQNKGDQPRQKPAQGQQPRQPQQGQQAQGNKKDRTGPLQARTKGEKRTVNTRAGNVQLDKYNEHYEEIAPARNQRKDDSSSANKQKIKQKSQQYRKQGNHVRRKETEQEKMARLQLERAKRPPVVSIPDEISVQELALRLKMTSKEVIAKIVLLGLQNININSTLDFETAEIIATELGAKVKKEVVVTIEERIIDDSDDDEGSLIERDPVVVVMGHVDHGKTSLLDAIRHANVTATEAGGITQHIGAHRVEVNGKKITFLDTPGHAAFTSMRARGAMATDIAVLVVAADDGIMPQTVEAINHAKAAGATIIVAINKMDKPDVNPDKIKQQLTEYELVPEDWGGDTICVPVSAVTKMGIPELLESILLVAEMMELKANPDRKAKGVVIEARLDKGRGPIATLLVQNGTLRSGDIIVAGTAVGKVRAMTDDKGKSVKKAGPSVPVEIMGLTEVPQAGDNFDAVSDERLARELVEQRKEKIKNDRFSSVQKVTLENLFSSLQAGEVKDLNVIIKADVQGSAEAIKQNLEKLSNDEVRVRVIHSGVGAVNDSDATLAVTSGAIIVGFNVRPDNVAAQIVEREGVDMRMYRVIYDCIEEISAAMKGLLAPKTREVELGKAEVRNVINISSVGSVAGCYVQSGKILRNAKIRVVRDGIVIADDEISSLKRFKDDVKEVASGYECGILLSKFNDIKLGDVLEAYTIEEYRE